MRIDGWLNNELRDAIITDVNAWLVTAADDALGSAYNDALDWRNAVYQAVNCPADGWYSQLGSIGNDMASDYLLLSGWHTAFSALAGNFTIALERLEDWYDDLGDFRYEMEIFYGDIADFMYHELGPWHGTLYAISGILSYWYSELNDFAHGTYCSYGIVYTPGLFDIYTALNYLYYWLYYVEMPDLPDYEY